MENLNSAKNNKEPEKETWSKPKIELIGINEETLGNFHAGGDTTGGS